MVDARSGMHEDYIASYKAFTWKPTVTLPQQCEPASGSQAVICGYL